MFDDVLGYEYRYSKRNRPNWFISRNNSTSRVAVVNTKELNIKDVNDENGFFDRLFAELIKDEFPADNAAIIVSNFIDDAHLKELAIGQG